MKKIKSPTVPRNFIDDVEGNYDIDGVSHAPTGVVISGDKKTPTESKKKPAPQRTAALHNGFNETVNWQW